MYQLSEWGICLLFPVVCAQGSNLAPTKTSLEQN